MLTSEERMKVAAYFDTLQRIEASLRHEITQSLPAAIAAQCLSTARLSLMHLLQIDATELMQSTQSRPPIASPSFIETSPASPVENSP